MTVDHKMRELPARITVIGIGEEGFAHLPALSQQLLSEAEIIVGGERHRALLPEALQKRFQFWLQPFSKNLALLEKYKGRKLSVIATGDPMHYGVGAFLASHYPPDQMTILPAPGAFSLAASRLGWPLQKIETLSLHGRPVEQLIPFLQPSARLLVLTSDGQTPSVIVETLISAGFEQSDIYVLERIGSKNEKIQQSKAHRFKNRAFADLNIVAVECAPVPSKPWHPRMPGLSDDVFLHDGQLTKSEVRAASLAKLMPCKDALLWDVGAGSGSISIEWMRAGGRALAIEPQSKRRDFILKNAAFLGTPSIEIKKTKAPSVFDSLKEKPDAIFIGGGLTEQSKEGDGLLEKALHHLKEGGRLVANAVTLEGEAILIESHKKRGGHLCRIAVSRLEAVGPFQGFKPAMSVTQYQWIKK